MTPNQIKKALTKGGMDMSAVYEVHRDEVEIFVDNGSGRANERKTQSAIKAAKKILGWKGGYYTGYGSLVLQANPTDKGDYNDKASAWHY